MPTAKSQAVRKYNAKTYDRIEVVVPKGQKEAIKILAKQAGESVNSFIVAAIQEKMNQYKKDAEV